ncbi:hypothetical protein BABINDRAFT_9562 [Babjeviella inositovora NRRL Y-12698]|uniref:Uncharacterized protein n=1 Tax=Babjeviella inositovora NRRL Y-12698 TaxID=984486 RepID=A0A1E3QJS9_9ASCO|nr:uncharacterized protein BABINDRAFT_9562 [Babjeviella inositovora NRRL Y-12698]ODQ77946.1 hypothetical protein BABINDRAFT_9562 [Babjeviella inositovora NRRL Y-12698]
MFLTNKAKTLVIAIFGTALLALHYLMSLRFLTQVVLVATYDIDTIFNDRFSVNVLTNNCSRNTNRIVAFFPELAVWNDTVCTLMPDSASYVSGPPVMGDVGLYTKKYTRAVRLCAYGDKMLCLFLEDDITWLFDVDETKRRLVLNTILYYSNDDATWDCSKYGIGWFKTGATGNKLQCRIISKETASCMAGYMDRSGIPADIALRDASKACSVRQGRFLLVQHTGGRSILKH